MNSNFVYSKSKIVLLLFLMIVEGLTTVSAQEDLRAERLRAPALKGNWVNGKPVVLGKGNVNIIQFWTLGCINCKHNLPAYNRWYNQLKNEGIGFAGVHSPEFDWEKDEKTLLSSIKEHGIDYPVLPDNLMLNWDAWQQRYWPTVYIIDKEGYIRYRWIGELGKKGAEAKILALARDLKKE
jgi:thiol-disulfide isomerase/thioredoxin